MDLKVGQIWSSGSFDYIILKIDQTTEMVMLKSLSDNRKYDWTISGMCRWTLKTTKIDHEECSTESHKCNCNLSVIMSTGCQCGGV